jgi:hypothetical protein
MRVSYLPTLLTLVLFLLVFYTTTGATRPLGIDKWQS